MNNGNKKIEVSESNIKAAFKVADESTKKMLVTLFGNIEPTDTNKPSLKDYRTIRSYADACEALGESIDEKKLKVAGVPKHIIAQMKLELVCKALWGGEVKVYPDPDGDRIYWYPCFGLYKQSEITDMCDKEKDCLLAAITDAGMPMGFGYLSVYNRSSYSVAYGGFRLYLDTEEKAEYFGKQFLELWAEAIVFNFTIFAEAKRLY